LPSGGDLLRGRRPRPVERVHPAQCRLLRRTRFARRRVEGRTDRQRPTGNQGRTAEGRGLATAMRVSASLPVFPWDTLADVTAVARAHPDGIVDLSVGTPVDGVAPVIRNALADASSAPGYPTTAGTSALRAS